MGLARSAKAGEKPAKALPVKRKEKATASFKVPPSLHQQLSTLAGLLRKTNAETIEWLLNLSDPVLDEMRESVSRVNRIRKE